MKIQKTTVKTGTLVVLTQTCLQKIKFIWALISQMWKSFEIVNCWIFPPTLEILSFNTDSYELWITQVIFFKGVKGMTKNNLTTAIRSLSFQQCKSLYWKYSSGFQKSSNDQKQQLFLFTIPGMFETFIKSREFSVS